MLEDGEAEVVHRTLADADGAFDLGDGEHPPKEQVSQVEQADHEDSLIGRAGAGKVREVSVDADLDELRAKQLRDGGSQGEPQVERKSTAIGPLITGEPGKGRPVHPLLRELLFEFEIDL